MSRLRRRPIIRYALDIENLDPVVVISGGGTAVWNAQFFKEIIRKALEREHAERLSYNLVVSPPDSIVEEFGVKQNRSERRKCVGRMRRKENGQPAEYALRTLKVEAWCPEQVPGVLSQRVRFLGDVIDGTYQVIYHGVNLIVSRAGGGTVNDAIACRTPVVCVEEPKHWQVEKIRENLERAGLTRTVRLEDFKNNPLDIVERELLEKSKENAAIRRAMARVRNHCEVQVVDQILELFFNRQRCFNRRVDHIRL